MLEYAVRVTNDPASVGPDDIEALRQAGFDDTGILDICQVTAYYAYVNRLADGLGIELEPWWDEADMTVTASEFESRTGGR